ncbi:cation transporter, partial [Streptomyces megasporus]|uniref:cation transporter n=1 Tax=Streptomyces megasporus TaxID=44060 RepID=UPI0004E12404
MSTTSFEAPESTAGPTTEVELAIGGMTCAACATRVEKKLNRMDGVTATVNLATEKARVTHSPEVTVDDLIATVVKTGYTARLPEPPAPSGSDTGPEGASNGGDREPDALRERFLVSLALSLPVVLLSMVPALQFDNWQWLSLTLAAPVVVWGALPFHKAALTNLRHGSATMDTLVSLGTLAAFGWSL